MDLSSFGKKFSTEAGILTLMDDLGNALSRGGFMMLGGGNPGQIPEVQEVFRRRLQDITADPVLFRQLIGIYDPPQGELKFLQALVELFRREYGWRIGPENICLTNGSQNSFFLLFNMFAGTAPGGGRKKILLPLAPEYIGYADLGLTDDFFVSVRPLIEERGDNLFKYRVDFDRIEISAETAALCVSRPTNPTGNVLTDREVEGLMDLASASNIPLIIDNAYGVPFPGIVYTKATPYWNEDIIVCMSLSKFGLPAVRTGIVVAGAETVRILSRMNAVMNLATGSFGPMLATEITGSGEILRLSRGVIQPFYRRKMEKALALVREYFSGLDYLVHVPEGAMFLWLWFRDLPISSRALYERLKQRNVLVVSGHYFFPGLAGRQWRHTQECIRITYSQADELVQEGLKIIAREVRAVYSEQA
jgi:valine--pyruvate aminotransferase